MPSNNQSLSCYGRELSYEVDQLHAIRSSVEPKFWQVTSYDMSGNRTVEYEKFLVGLNPTAYYHDSEIGNVINFSSSVEVTVGRLLTYKFLIFGTKKRPVSVGLTFLSPVEDGGGRESQIPQHKLHYSLGERVSITTLEENTLQEKGHKEPAYIFGVIEAIKNASKLLEAVPPHNESVWK